MTTTLDTLILFSVNPIGFMIVMSLLVFFEYLILKSVIKDMKIALNYIKNHKSKFTALVSHQTKAIDIILKRKTIIIKDISTTAGVAINYIKMNNWFH